MNGLLTLTVTAEPGSHRNVGEIGLYRFCKHQMTADEEGEQVLSVTVEGPENVNGSFQKMK